jgi:TPR repeat protein
MCFFKRFKIKRLIKQLKLLQSSRLQNQGNVAMQQKEIAAYVKLADIYEHVKGKKKFPFAREQAIACYRAAALLGDVPAQYTLGVKLLDEAKLRDSLQQNSLFATESNALFMRELYKESHGFLLEAEKKQHINAKRIRGLCYINGWGVDIDKDHGFDLVVASIEQENSWDRVQKIFAQLGINKSSFFSELFQHRRNP